MPRNWSNTVPEGNGPVPHQDEFGSDQLTIMAHLYRVNKGRFDQSDRYLDRMKSHFDQQEDTKLDEFMEMTRGTRQRFASLEQDTREPRLVMEADGPADTKTRGRTEGAATTAVKAMRGDSFSANRVDPDLMCSTSFGVKAEPSAVACRDDVLVENGAAASKSCLSSLEMRSPTAAGGLLPTGKTSLATWTIFDQPTL